MFTKVEPILLLVTAPIALLIAGCETTSDDPLGIINEIVEKGVEASA